MTNALDYKRLAAAAGHAQRLAGHLHGATAYRICERSSADMLINDAIKELRDCAAAMGFDLVERMTADEASRLAGAPTWKSPLDGKFAPEFLGDTPNGTTMGFR